MNCIIYSRVSTFDQDNQRQIDELKHYAKYRKFKVVKVFEEKITGTSKAAERMEFKKLLELVEIQKIDSILVWELSRLGRSMLDVLNTIEALSQKGINIYIKKEGMNTLENGKKSVMTNMLISILSGFAEMERETIRQRSISGIRQNVSTGGSGTGVIKAYGYEKVGKKLFINKEEAKVVKLIFDKYLSGLGTGQIASYLNQEKIPTRFNKLFTNKKIKQKYGILKKGSDYTWKDGTVYTILTNSIYKGERKHKGEVFQIDPIVKSEIFDSVQTKLSSNFNKQDSNRKYDNYLKDILICGKCGRSYFMHKRANGKDNAYKCISKRYKEYCGNPSIGIDKLLRSLYVTVSPLLLINKVMSIEYKKSVKGQLSEIDKSILSAEKEIKSLNNQLDNLIGLNITGQLTTAQFTKFNQELTNKLNKTKSQVEKLMVEKEKLSDYNDSIQKNKMKEMDEELFKSEIRKGIKTIVVNDAKTFKSKYKKDIAVQITVQPIIATLPVTNYILTRHTSSIYYMDKKKVVEELPLN